MTDSTLFRSSGASLMAGGLATALFWLLTLPVGTFVGADAALHPLWVPGQLLHVVGALLATFGLIGLYIAQGHRAGVLGLVGFILAMTGTMLFLADGIVALAIFPAVAAAAPPLLAPDGALNRGPALAAFITFAATNLIGQVVFGAATLRAAVFPRAAAVLVLAGGVLFNLPPGPVPLAVLAAGGVLWGAGAAWLGGALRRIAGSAVEGGPPRR